MAWMFGKNSTTNNVAKFAAANAFLQRPNTDHFDPDTLATSLAVLRGFNSLAYENIPENQITTAGKATLSFAKEHNHFQLFITAIWMLKKAAGQDPEATKLLHHVQRDLLGDNAISKNLVDVTGVKVSDGAFNTWCGNEPAKEHLDLPQLAPR